MTSLMALARSLPDDCPEPPDQTSNCVIAIPSVSGLNARFNQRHEPMRYIA